MATNLEVMEDRAEKALQRAVSGWRTFGETLKEIKESGAYKDTHGIWEITYASVGAGAARD